MALMKEVRRRARYAAGQVLGCLVVGYFAYHLVEGDRGLLAMRYLKQEIVQTRQELGRVEGQRRTMEARVALLRPSGLDPDILDERARIMLNLAGPGDIVILSDWSSSGQSFLGEMRMPTPLVVPAGSGAKTIN